LKIFLNQNQFRKYESKYPTDTLWLRYILNRITSAFKVEDNIALENEISFGE